jgi:uncharacterized membrane protein YjdF
VNLVLHTMVFAALNSGLWFVQSMRHPFNHLTWLTEAWALVLVIQLISVVAQRPQTPS